MLLIRIAAHHFHVAAGARCRRLARIVLCGARFVFVEAGTAGARRRRAFHMLTPSSSRNCRVIAFIGGATPLSEIEMIALTIPSNRCSSAGLRRTGNGSGLR